MSEDVVRRDDEAYGLRIDRPYKKKRLAQSQVITVLLLIFCLSSAALLAQQAIYHYGASKYKTAVSVMQSSAEQSAAESLSVFAIENAPVNINTADLTELCRLPGIGESKAQAILDYRDENGPFTYPEEIKNVNGIGDGIYEKIAPQIILSGTGATE